MQWGRNTLIEQAKEELEILEYQHPNKFNCLKQDLKAYISELESQNQTATSISASTQESSNINNRNKRGASRLIMPDAVRSRKRRGKLGNTDAVLQRAQQCLKF